MREWLCRFLLVLFMIPTGLRAADVSIRGMAQSWISYAEVSNQYGYELGFVVRRLRLNPYGTFGEKFSWSVGVGWDEGIARLLDAYLDYRVSDTFSLRIGQFPVPGARSGELTDSGDLDFVERAAVTSKWGDYSRMLAFRSIGLQVSGRLMKGRVKYAVMLANPRTLQVFSPSIKDPFIINVQNYGLAVWGNLEVVPIDGLSFGAFYGSGYEDDTHYKRDSYGAHLYFMYQNWKAKIEYIAGQNEIPAGTTPYDGVYAVLGRRFGKMEALIRYGFYSPIADTVNKDGVKKFNNITLGINMFVNEHVKLQANYVVRDEIMAEGFNDYENNIFYFCCQYRF